MTILIKLSSKLELYCPIPNLMCKGFIDTKGAILTLLCQINIMSN